MITFYRQWLCLHSTDNDLISQTMIMFCIQCLGFADSGCIFTVTKYTLSRSTQWQGPSFLHLPTLETRKKVLLAWILHNLTTIQWHIKWNKTYITIAYMLNRLLNGKGLSRSLLVGITDGGVDRNRNGRPIIMPIYCYRQSINPSLKLQTRGGWQKWQGG